MHEPSKVYLQPLLKEGFCNKEIAYLGQLGAVPREPEAPELRAQASFSGDLQDQKLYHFNVAYRSGSTTRGQTHTTKMDRNGEQVSSYPVPGPARKHLSRPYVLQLLIAATRGVTCDQLVKCLAPKFQPLENCFQRPHHKGFSEAGHPVPPIPSPAALLALCSLPPDIEGYLCGQSSSC